ncbi:MAG: UbiX family flavin prenyltransferase [Bdellovibrionales bacterium]|nr:UbiX family flavin prenyltransferase [Bdellovibrionales bacterium]
MHNKATWIVAMTGASGARYGLRLLEVLAEKISQVHFICSEAALRVLAEEEDLKISHSAMNCTTLLQRDFQNIHFHSVRDIGACIASGSFRADGMAIVPCSMNTLGAIANGIASNLVQRAAEVTMKEGRKLILVPRETPLAATHLENMLKLSRLGVSITPAMPGYYNSPKGISDLVDTLVMKILDQMGIDNQIAPRWKDY